MTNTSRAAAMMEQLGGVSTLVTRTAEERTKPNSEALSEGWWNRLTRQGKADYLKDHPNSKYAKQAGGADAQKGSAPAKVDVKKLSDTINAKLSDKEKAELAASIKPSKTGRLLKKATPALKKTGKVLAKAALAAGIIGGAGAVLGSAGATLAIAAVAGHWISDGGKVNVLDQFVEGLNEETSADKAMELVAKDFQAWLASKTPEELEKIIADATA